MSRRLQYRLSTIVVTLAVPVVCYCLSRMIPPGLAGNFTEVKWWFAAMTAATVAGAVAFFVMTYTRSMLSGLGDNAASETDILAAAAADMRRQKQAAKQAFGADPTKPTRPR